MTPMELKAFRKGKGLNQAALAKALGVSRKTVVNWEGSIFAIPGDLMIRLANKGLAAMPSQPARQTKLDRDTFAAYAQMRNRDHFTHDYILRFWGEVNFTPSQEAQRLIVEAFPELLPPKAPVQ